jgi:HSP20 family protein
MARKQPPKRSEEGPMKGGGFLGGLSTLLEKLGELAEKGETLRRTGEVPITDEEGRVHGVYGFSIKVGLGDEGVKVEPFGNVRKDEQTGRTVIDEVREPMVDVFDEQDHVLVVAEMPGVGEEDVQLELVDDILTINAAHGDIKYHKEVLLPGAFPADKMSRTCHNGLLKVKFAR